MGTNFYVKKEKLDGVDCWHLGKSSHGWCFALHVYPEVGINDLGDWESDLETGAIVNEYGDVLTKSEMMKIITERKFRELKPIDLSGHTEEQFHLFNGSEMRPNGLLRHRVDKFCISHGSGTWDCCVGKFS